MRTRFPRGRWTTTRAVVLSWLLLLPAAEAFAGGFTNLDFGIRRMGMFAVTARPDDGTAIFHNPAGMTLLEGTQLYHSQSWFVSTLGFKMYDSAGRLQPEDHEIEPSWSVGVIPFFGVTTDFGLEDLRAGFGIYAPNAYGAALPSDEATRYHATKALFIAARATWAAAYEVTDQWSVGASVSLVPVYLMASRVMNPAVLTNPDERFKSVAETKALDAKLDIDGLDFTWAWDVGIIFRPIETLRIGLVFSSGSAVRLEGDVSLKLADGSTQKTRHTTWMAIPFTLRAGINWEFAPNFEIAADIYWWHYQVLQEQRTKLNDPIMGLSEFVDPKNYGNSWNWCLGLLYHVLPSLEVMVGYQEDYTPIPETTFTLDNPSRDQRGIALGVRWQVLDNLRLGFAYCRNWFQLPDVQESISTPPSNMKGHGANDEFGLDVLWRL